MRRCKLLITTGDVTYQYRGGVGPSPKGRAGTGAGSAHSQPATSTADMHDLSPLKASIARRVELVIRSRLRTTWL